MNLYINWTNFLIEKLLTFITGQLIFLGDDKLTLYEKTFLSRMKPTVLCEAEGGVLSIAWTAQFVAWASTTGVRVYDLNSRCSLGLITWPRSGE